MTVNKLDASLSLENQTRLLQLHLLQPLVMETTPAGRKLGNSAGELATLTLSDIDLDWFSAFVPDATLKGRLSRADLSSPRTPGHHPHLGQARRNPSCHRRRP
jgi:hypothetical protein